MPNIKQLEELRRKYYTYYKDRNNFSHRELKLINESFRHDKKDELVKAFLSNPSLNSDVITYFENQETAHVTLLFIDISNFSNKCKEMTNDELSDYLDDYYDKVIPIIYDHQGEIEKIIGDGIICVFGQPFLDDKIEILVNKADKCAKEIIAKLENTDKEVKVAVHDGDIMYYKNKTEEYPEYTMIGQSLTELFRLESASYNNSINFFIETEYEKSKRTSSVTEEEAINSKKTYWQKYPFEAVELKGVDFKYMGKLKKVSTKSKFIGNYDIINSAKAIDKILDKSIRLPVLKKFPTPLELQKLDNFLIKTAVVSINIRLLENIQSQTELIKIKKIIFGELIPLLSNHITPIKIIYEKDKLICIYEIFSNKEIKDVYINTTILNSFLDIINSKLKLRYKNSISIGIGIDYDEIIVLKINFDNYIFYGKAIDTAKFLSEKAFTKYNSYKYYNPMNYKMMVLSNRVYTKLSPRSQSFFNEGENCWHGSVINSLLNNTSNTYI